MQPRLDGIGGPPELLAQFLPRPTFAIRQHDAVPRGGVDALQAMLQRLAVDPLPGGVARLGDFSQPVRAILARRDEVRRFPSENVDRAVPRDRDQPPHGRTGGGGVLARIPPDPEINVLQDVFRRSPLHAHTQ